MQCAALPMTCAEWITISGMLARFSAAGSHSSSWNPREDGVGKEGGWGGGVSVVVCGLHTRRPVFALLTCMSTASIVQSDTLIMSKFSNCSLGWKRMSSAAAVLSQV